MDDEGLREQIEALAADWERQARNGTARGYPSPHDGLTFAQERHAAALRAVLRGCRHAVRCCSEHGTHASPHVGCILR